MSKTETTDPEQQSSGTLRAILIVAVAIAALVGLYAYSNMLAAQHPPEAPELPIATVMIEFQQLDAATRAQIVALQKQLEATGVFGKPSGPADAKVLLPGAKPGDRPVAKAFDTITDSEWEAAFKFVSMTEYLVPRLFRLDGTACIIRLDPKGGRDFSPDAAAKLQQVLDGFKDKFKTLRAYSRALQVGSAADRDAINASFGVQTCWIMIEEPVSQQNPQGSSWKTAGGIKKLGQCKNVLKTERHFRRVTTDANWVSYYWTVKLQTEKESALPGRDEEVVEAYDFAQANGIGVLLTKDAKGAVVDTSTDTEGQENAKLLYFMAANLQQELKVEAKGPYRPKIQTPLRGDPIPEDKK